MSLPQIAERLMCSHAKIELSKVRKRQLTEQDYGQLLSSCGIIAETPFFLIDSPRLSIGQCASHIRRLAKTDEARIVIVDYLQLIHGPTRDGRVQEVGHISRTLKETARSTDCSILSLCQLNRDVEKRDSKRPRMSDLRESGSIEQDADRVLMLHRESYYHQGDDQWHNENPTASGEAEIIVAKNRHGSTGIATIGWDARTTTFQGPVGPLPKEDYQQWR